MPVFTPFTMQNENDSSSFDFKQSQQKDKYRHYFSKFINTAHDLEGTEAKDTLNRLLNNRKRPYFIVGKHNTGKTTIIKNFLKQSNAKFFYCDASCINTENDLIQAFRKAVFITIKEMHTIIEGEIIDIRADRIMLKTTDMESEFTMGGKMIDKLVESRIGIGDVIQIVKETGNVNKIGKSFVRPHEYDLLGPDVRFVPCPEGDLTNIKETETLMTLNDLDILNSSSVPNLYSPTFVSDEVKAEVDKKINEWIEEGKAEMEIGTLVIENLELLESKYLAFIAHLMEGNNVPFIIYTANFEKTKITKELKKMMEKCFYIELQNLKIENLKDLIFKNAELLQLNLTEETISALLEYCKNYGIKLTLEMMKIYAVTRKGQKQMSADEIRDFLTLFN